MNRLVKLAAVVLPIALVGACTTLSDKDRTLLDSANRNATEAKDIASRALTTAQQAQTSAAASAQAAQQAAADAKAAAERADRMFQKSLHK